MGQLRGNWPYLRGSAVQKQCFSTRAASVAGLSLLKFAAYTPIALTDSVLVLPALAAKSRTRSLGIAAARPVPVRCASLKVQASQKGVGIVFEIVPAEASRSRFARRSIVRGRAA